MSLRKFGTPMGEHVGQAVVACSRRLIADGAWARNYGSAQFFDAQRRLFDAVTSTRKVPHLSAKSFSVRSWATERLARTRPPRPPRREVVMNVMVAGKSGRPQSGIQWAREFSERRHRCSAAFTSTS